MANWKRGVVIAALGLSLACTGLAQPDRIRGPVDQSSSITLHGNTHPKAQPKYDLGPAEASFPIKYVTMLLKQTEAQRVALDQLLADQQNLDSPEYRKWLTPEKYAQRFGVSQNDVGKIATWLRSEGFTVESTARGRDWIAFSGTAARVHQAFHTAVHRYAVDGEMHFGISRDPSIPGVLEPLVAALVGLDDFGPQPSKLFRPANSAASGLITLAPDDLATIYNLHRLYQAGIDGTGQKIAVVGMTAIDLSDIQGFRSMYGLSGANVKFIRTGPDPGVNQSFLSEAGLDIEWAGATAPKATVLYVYSASLDAAVFYAIDQ